MSGEIKTTAKENINQELTRQNIIELRKKHGYTQIKIAELMGGSRTIYNGIENGKVKITEYYVQTLAVGGSVFFQNNKNCYRVCSD